MKKLIFTNHTGESVEFSDAFPFLVGTIEGLGSANVSLQTQKAPYQDGVTYLDITLEPRTLSIEVLIRATTREQIMQHRCSLARIFNPKLGPGTLRYEYDGGMKEISAISELAPVFPDGKENSGSTFQKALFTLFCPSPFWLDIITESKEIVTWIGGMTFPLRLPTAFATKGPKRINIINQGDVETPVRIEFKGPATNPRITNQTTGEYIQVNRSLLNTDKLIITTDFGAKRVEIENEFGVRTNAFNWIDLGSSFWSLQVGDNVVEYSSDDQVEPAAVSVSYRNRYIGI